MRKKIVILGGGIGGLSCGWMLARTKQYDVTVIEKAAVVGGASATFTVDGYSLDYGPHKFYSVIPGIQEEGKTLLGAEFLTLEKKNSIFLFNSFLSYPLSMAQLFMKMGPANIVASAVSIAASFLGGKKNAPASYESFIINRFGRKLYSLVFEPLATKTWGDPATLSADIARTRIPSTGIVDVLLRLLGLRKETETTDAKHFLYPARGFGRIAERMAEEITTAGGTILLNSEPVKALTGGKRITGIETAVPGGTKTIPCDQLISAIPLPALVDLFKETTEPRRYDSLKSHVRRLQYRDAFLVYIFLDREKITSDHWIFFPGSDVIFGRIFEQKCLSSAMIPSGNTVICCDFTDYPQGPVSGLTDDELARRCVNDLEKVGIIKKEWVKDHAVRRLPGFYPRYDIPYKDTVRHLFTGLKEFDNLLATGRVGFYNYNNIDHCMDMARLISQELAGGAPVGEIWNKLEERVSQYRIVD